MAAIFGLFDRHSEREKHEAEMLARLGPDEYETFLKQTQRRRVIALVGFLALCAALAGAILTGLYVAGA